MAVIFVDHACHGDGASESDAGDGRGYGTGTVLTGRAPDSVLTC